MEIDKKDDAEQSDERGSNDVQSCLLERSVHVLYLYQSIKPGILTESGFNICKLLVLNKRVNENVIKDSLDLMLKEKHVMSWLDKVRLKFSIRIYRIIMVTPYKLKQNESLSSKINIIYILQDSRHFKKWSFLLKISSVNVAKSAYGFGHIYWRNPQKRTLWSETIFDSWKPFKSDDKCLLFHFNSSFHS